jgi:hypothetical protein
MFSSSSVWCRICLDLKSQRIRFCVISDRRCPLPGLHSMADCFVLDRLESERMTGYLVYSQLKKLVQVLLWLSCKSQ